MKHEGWQGLVGSMGVSLTTAMADQLARFHELLLDQAVPAGMVSFRDASRIGERHLLDAMRAAPLVDDADARAYDLGSGAGLPGIPLAVVRPQLHVILVEVRRHRVDFLRHAIDELGLSNTSVYPRRVETLRERVSLCFGRAFAPARRTWEVADRLLLPGGRLVYWAGRRFDPHVDLPTSPNCALFPARSLARSGPLVIMIRQ